MNDDIPAASAAISSQSVGLAFGVSVLRKAQDAQRSQGEQAVRLIEASGPQMTKTSDGHISVRA